MINDKEMINDKKNQVDHIVKDKQSLHADRLTDIPNNQVI